MNYPLSALLQFDLILHHADITGKLQPTERRKLGYNEKSFCRSFCESWGKHDTQLQFPNLFVCKNISLLNQTEVLAEQPIS